MKHACSKGILALSMSLLAGVAACPADPGAYEFPCLDNSDCALAAGFVCDPQQQRCVTGVVGEHDAGGEDAGRQEDAGPAPMDAGGARDGGPAALDAGNVADSGSSGDAGLDGGAVDGGAVDAGAVDAGAVDAGAVDGGAQDAGDVDAGLDAGGQDVAPLLEPSLILCEEDTPCVITLDASVDGDASGLTGSAVTSPLRGQLSAFTNLTAVYTPNAGEIGEDSFLASVSDGALDSDSATIRVRVISRRSCAHLLLTGGASESGLYAVFPNGPAADSFSAYCDMSREGGGWTLALKADGRGQTFTYTAPLWSNTTLHNDTATSLDDTEAKLQAFTTLPLAQVLLLLRPVDAPWSAAQGIKAPARSSSLQQLFAAGTYVPTARRRASWLELLPNTTLQRYCRREGFNVDPVGTGSHARARIGIVGNEQMDCSSPDSFIGVGTGGTICNENPVWSAGNRSCAFPIGGDQSTPAFAAVLVREDDFRALDARASCSAHLFAGRSVDGTYLIDPDGEGGALPFPAYCDMSTDGGGWTLLMRIAGDSSSHALDNDAAGEAPCLPEAGACKVSTSTISEILGHEGTQVLAVRPDDNRYLPWFVRAENDAQRWPSNLECSNRAALLADGGEDWILTSYPSVAAAELAVNGDVGDYATGGHYYPTPYATEQLFFHTAPGGLRSNQSWSAAGFVSGLAGTLWVRTSGFEHLGVAQSCLEHLALGREQSGVYLVSEAPGPDALRVYCDMKTDGGGWTVLASYSGANGEASLTTGGARAEGSPFGFGHVNLDVASKLRLTAGATETLLVRSSGQWLRLAAPPFDATLSVPSSEATFETTVTASDGTSASAFVGWSNYDIGFGGDLGISVAPEPGFDHHSNAYRKLNSGCANQLLYSYSAGAGDGDVGYDANVGLGSWSATQSCEAAEGGRLRFYLAVR